MKHSYSRWTGPFVVLLAALLLGFACGRPKERLYPFGWSRLDSRFDSLTLIAEYAFLESQPDSLIANIVTQMKEVADSAPANRQLTARYHYWFGRLNLRYRNIDKAFDEFNSALALTDSARFPYDVARIRWNMDLDDRHDAEGYFNALSMRNRFREFDDLAMQAAYDMELGAMMSEMGNHKLALSYFSSADSLLQLAEIYGEAARNVINRSKALEGLGRQQEAAALLKVALQDSLFRKQPIAVNIALWNLYLFTDSLALLREAISLLPGDFNEPEYRPLYNSYLMKEYARRGMTDSLPDLIRKVEADTATLMSPWHFNQYLTARARAAAALGDYKGASEMYERSVGLFEEMQEDESAQFVADAENRRMIDERIYLDQLKRKDRTVMILAISVAVALGLAILAFVYRRRYTEQLKEKLEESRRHEQARRKVAALEIAMEENRKLTDELRDSLHELKKEGLMTSAASGALDATLRAHDISRSQRESFMESYAGVSPQFLKVLDETYPGLSKSERRLASYISLGLDNKHIGRLTGVRPESVKQARWRLRSKLGLAEGVSLDDILRALNENV